MKAPASWVVSRVPISYISLLESRSLNVSSAAGVKRPFSNTTTCNSRDDILSEMV